MVDNVIQIVTEKLSSLPCIEGIVLGGSRARGTHTEDSDIDIGIYYNSESFDLTAINQIATELDDENRNDLVVPPGAWGDWVNGGGWLVINGYHVDLILRDIKRVEQIIKDTEQGIVTANYQTGHPHGYISAMYRGELAISKIQYAKNESLCELKNQAEIYPGALKKSLINFFMKIKLFGVFALRNISILTLKPLVVIGILFLPVNSIATLIVSKECVMVG